MDIELLTGQLRAIKLCVAFELNTKSDTFSIGNN